MPIVINHKVHSGEMSADYEADKDGYLSIQAIGYYLRFETGYQTVVAEVYEKTNNGYKLANSQPVTETWTDINPPEDTSTATTLFSHAIKRGRVYAVSVGGQGKGTDYHYAIITASYSRRKPKSHGSQ